MTQLWFKLLDSKYWKGTIAGGIGVSGPDTSTPCMWKAMLNAMIVGDVEGLYIPRKAARLDGYLGS